jgi:DNA-binding XRE family transcriptional regulator
MVPNKRTLILASSLGGISLASLLVASAIQRRRRKSQRTHRFLGQTKSTADANTTSAIERQQPNEKSQGQEAMLWQGTEINAVTRTTMKTTTTTTNAAATTKSTTATIPAAVSSPIAPSSTSSDSAVIVTHQGPKEEETSLSEEASKVGGSLKELIVTAVKEAKDSAKQTGKQVKDQTINIATTVDSKDIRSLGDNVDALVDLFEQTMIEIRKERYDGQIKLLNSYKELLEMYIKVVHVRSRMARKLKPGS